jgi:monoamine oxidase
VASLLGDALDDVNTASELVRVKQTAAGSYELTFNEDSATKVAIADHVVLALPFSILRRSVDFTRAGFSDRKKRAIRELGMGTNSKLNVQFTSRFWEPLGSNGATYSDTGYQNTWDVTRGQSGASGILVDYTAGTGFGGDPTKRSRKFLSQLEPVLPGATRAWNGRATLDYWPDYEWTKGSYSYWKVGQVTGFGGVEGEASGNCHFAGEHTSINFQGYLNGAVESGERAAGEVLAAL